MNLKLDALDEHLAKKLAPLYVVHGDEHLLAIEASDKIRAAARAAGYSERDLLEVDRYFHWSRIAESGQSRSLFGDRKLIEVRIPGGKPGRDGALALQAHAKSASRSEDAITLVTLPGLRSEAKSSTWFTALSAAGVAIEAPPVDRVRLPNWIAERLAAQGQSADREALAFIVDRVEGNLLAAHQEVQKLALLHPRGKLSFDDVRDAVLDVARYDVFKLGEAMLAGDAARVARMVDGLKGEGESPVLVHWAMTEEVRALLRAKLAVAKGQSLGGLLRQLRVWGARERLFEPALKRLSLSTLRNALARAVEIDRIVKGLHNLRTPPLDRPQGPAMSDAWTELSRLGMTIAGRNI